jgi:hypothetical protein
MRTSQCATSAIRKSLWEREEISSVPFGGDDPTPSEGAGLSHGGELISMLALYLSREAGHCPPP